MLHSDVARHARAVRADRRIKPNGYKVVFMKDEGHYY
jgi:hypothetical protein